jgi:uncharacterized protein YraI
VFRLVTFVTLVTLVAGGVALVPIAVQADAGISATTASETTDKLNLRAAPALNAEILWTMPAGSAVTITGAPENGFYPVTFQGMTGFAYGAYLSGVDFSDGPVMTGGQQGEVNVVDGPVNHRTGPSTDDPVITVIPDGALVALTGDSANGFVSVTYNDINGWAHAASVFGTEDGDTGESAAPPPTTDTPAEPGGTSVPVGDAVTGLATVVDGGLNLRTGPSTDYAVILTIPDGAMVELRGDGQNGFLPVDYNGTTGWAFGDWLQVAGQEPPAGEAPPATDAPDPTTEPAPTEEPVPTEEPSAPPVDGSDGYTEDEIIQIIYAAADEYGQPREDMLRVAQCESLLDPNAVNATSGASGLFQFLPITWARTPWANDDIFDPVANAQAAAWMWANGNRGEWTCQ